MGHFFVVCVRWLVRHALILLVIMVALVVFFGFKTSVAQLANARLDLELAQRVSTTVAAEPARIAAWIEALLPPGNSVSEAADALLRRCAAERTRREVERAAWRSGHLLAVHLPGSDAFLAVTRLDMEIGVLRKAEMHFAAQATLASVLLDADAARAKVKAEQAATTNAVQTNLLRRRALAAQHPVLSEIPGTGVYREIDRLDAERGRLREAAAGHEVSLKQLDDAERLARAAKGPFRVAHAELWRAMEPTRRQLDARIAELEASIVANLWRRVTEELGSVFVPAVLILAGAVLSGPLIKAFAFFVLAPLAARRPPMCLLPGAGGALDVAQTEPGSGKVSRTSLPVVLRDGEELRVHADFIQSRPSGMPVSTRAFLDPSRPFTSLAAGMVFVQHLRPDAARAVVLSSTRSDLLELALLTLPAGSAWVLRPRSLVGLVQEAGRPVRITSHWRLASLHAWLDLQLRYLVFHGPGTLVVKGSRGVVVEPAGPGRIVNQAGVLGWSAGLARSSARCDSFAAYLFGDQDLLNDAFQGDGSFVHEEMPGAGASRGVVFGKGFTGLADTLLKIGGI